MAYKQRDKNFYNALDYGLDNTGSSDNAIAMRNLLFKTQSGTINTVFIPKGRYRFDSQVAMFGSTYNLTRELKIIGEPGTVLYTEVDAPNAILNLQTKQYNNATAITSDVIRGVDSFTIEFDDASGMEPGRIVEILDNDSVVESNWGSLANYIAVVVSKTGNIVTFDRPVYWFDLTALNNNTIRTFAGIKITIENLEFETPGLGAWATNSAINLRGCVPLVKNCKFSCPLDGVHTKIDNGITSSASVNGRIHNCKFQGTVYSILLNGLCRDFTVENIYCYRCRHPFILTVFSRNCSVQNVSSYFCTAGMDSHSSLDVTYKNFKSFGDREWANCRAMGNIVIDNCQLLSYDPDLIPLGYFTLPGSTVNPAWYYIRSLTDISITKSILTSPLRGGTLNGFSVPGCNRIHISDCVSHSMGSYNETTTQVLLENCITANAQNVGGPISMMKSCLFDGTMSPPTVGYAIRYANANSVRTTITNCRFKNYASTNSELFLQISSPNNSAMLLNCVVDDVEELADLYNSSFEYNRLMFINTSITGVDIPTSETNIQNSNQVMVINPPQYDLEVLVNNGNNRSTVPYKFIEVVTGGNISDGVDYNVTHNRNSDAVTVAIWETSGSYINTSEYSVTKTNDNSLAINFATAPVVDVDIIIY